MFLGHKGHLLGGASEGFRAWLISFSCHPPVPQPPCTRDRLLPLTCLIQPGLGTSLLMISCPVIPHSGDTQHFLGIGAPSSNKTDMELQYEMQEESDLLLVQFYFISSNSKHLLIIKSISENNDAFFKNTN